MLERQLPLNKQRSVKIRAKQPSAISTPTWSQRSIQKAQRAWTGLKPRQCQILQRHLHKLRFSKSSSPEKTGNILPKQQSKCRRWLLMPLIAVLTSVKRSQQLNLSLQSDLLASVYQSYTELNHNFKPNRALRNKYSPTVPLALSMSMQILKVTIGEAGSKVWALNILPKCSANLQN